ncbi:MAG: hypothetical protein KDD44_15280 [Bdellovibrionales bacterium]|nr:hypothetical protein [Bdellovibrionales bacterium]
MPQRLRATTVTTRFLITLLLFAAALAATSGVAFAQLTPPGSGVTAGDARIYEMGERLFQLIEGNLGSLIMIVAGLGVIISASLGSYRTALSLLVVSLGAFILRSLVVIFFNYQP